MKKTLFTTAVCAVTLTATAAQRTLLQMQEIAATQLHHLQVQGANRRAQAKAVTPQLLRITDVYAVFAPADNEGFVIVGRDDDVRPVLGYSTSSSFPTYDMPDGLKWYLQQLEQGALRRTQATFTPVENFVTTQWSQNYPFNVSTPNKYLAGCVATALAQCMNYCQWPESAEFEGHCSVTTKVGKKEKTEEQTLNISSTYTWPYKDNYKSSGRLTDNVDILLRDCGYATYMQYNADGSGTMTYLAGIALTQVFNYPEECVRYQERDCVASQDEWAQIIYDELAQRSPVLYGAHDETFGGHAFVLSGVDADGLVYANWGWRGEAEGFYDLLDLCPVQGGDEMHFENDHKMVYGIRTTPLPTDHYINYMSGLTGEPYTLRWGISTDDDGVERKTLYCELPYGFLNLNPADFQGVFGIFADDLTDGTSWVIEPELQDRATIPAGYGFASYDESYSDFAYYYYIDGEKGLKPGHTYRMAFGTCDDREGKWHSIVCKGGEVAYEVTYTGDVETSTVSAERTTPPVLTGIRELRPGNSSNNGNNANGRSLLSLFTRVYASDGRLVYTAPTSSFNLWDVPARGILIVDDGVTRRKVVR